MKYSERWPLRKALEKQISAGPGWAEQSQWETDSEDRTTVVGKKLQVCVLKH